MDEEDFESKAHITKTMTGGQSDVTRERTRVNSWEEQDYLATKEFLAKTLGVDFYQWAVDIHEGLKISKDGTEREEYVDILKGMYDEVRGFNTGLPLVREAIEEQQADKRNRR